MEQFKVDNFLKSETDAFPSFTPLSQDECCGIRLRLKSVLHLDEELDSLAIVSELSKRQVTCLGTNADSDEFNLQETLRNLGINAEKDVFINWHRFDTIDRMSCADLSKYFADIWYPASDDIDVFDLSLQWVLSIRHDGVVLYTIFLL